MEAENIEFIIEQYHPIFYKISRVYGFNSHEDDLYQEIIINVWNSLKNFKKESKLSTWLYRIALNTALTFQRNAKKYSRDIPSVEQVESPVSMSDEDDAEFKRNKLYAAISTLKPDQKAIILLYLEEKPYAEIAEITGLNISNVGVKLTGLRNE